MEQIVDGIGLGLSVSLAPHNILYCFLGVLLGTLIGVLPGIGPVPTIAILLPITYGLEPSTALITAWPDPSVVTCLVPMKVFPSGRSCGRREQVGFE